MGDADQAWLDRQREAFFPPHRNYLGAHLTMFHHLPPSLEAEVRQRLSEVARQGRLAARMGGPIALGQGVAYRIDSLELEDARAYLADLWSDVLLPQDKAAWRPHVTIQNKVTSAEARALFTQIEREFRPRPLAINGFASWWYRGGPWEPLSRHMVA